jgi:hypothetical protein
MNSMFAEGPPLPLAARVRVARSRGNWRKTFSCNPSLKAAGGQWESRISNFIGDIHVNVCFGLWGVARRLALETTLRSTPSARAESVHSDSDRPCWRRGKLERVGKVPPIPAEAFNVNAKDRDWVNRQCTMQPLATFQRLRNGPKERQPMTLRVERSARHGFTVFALSGRIEAEYIAGLKELFELGLNRQNVILDLIDLKLVDREGVRFLMRCEADGMKLEHCPAYVREWMQREKD